MDNSPAFCAHHPQALAVDRPPDTGCVTGTAPTTFRSLAAAMLVPTQLLQQQTSTKVAVESGSTKEKTVSSEVTKNIVSLEATNQKLVASNNMVSKLPGYSRISFSTKPLPMKLNPIVPIDQTSPCADVNSPESEAMQYLSRSVNRFYGNGGQAPMDKRLTLQVKSFPYIYLKRIHNYLMTALQEQKVNWVSKRRNLLTGQSLTIGPLRKTIWQIWYKQSPFLPTRSN